MMGCEVVINRARLSWSYSTRVQVKSDISFGAFRNMSDLHVNDGHPLGLIGKALMVLRENRIIFILGEHTI